jgi:hypothetical protein
MLHRVQ